MYCVDVNVLVHAYAPASPDHRACRSWLEVALEGRQPIALPVSVLSGFWRIVTHRKALTAPSSPDRATAFTDWLLAHPITMVPAVGQVTFVMARDLIRDLGLTGNDVPDAVLAATALDLRATLVTADRGFRRFRGLTVIDPTSG
jgi:toxin-antitoxin system PIN domain toxin